MSYVPMRISKSMMLPIAAAKCGLVSALRPFIRRPDVSFVAILKIPQQEDISLYKTAADELLSIKTSRVREYEDSQVVTTIDEFEHTNYRSDIFDLVRAAAQVVIFVTDLNDVPPKVKTLADITEVIAPPKLEHYLAAAKAIELDDMTKAHAKFLAEQPLSSIKLAFRHGRPLINSIRRLKKQALLEAKPVADKPQTSTLTLDKSHGYGPAKVWGEQLADDITAWQNGEIEWDDVDRGLLIYGPPGCGKSTYAKALAETCGIKLVIASAARWQAKGHLGDYLKAMRASFAEASAKSPAILFIDEFDSMGSRDIATNGDNVDYKRQSINALLECLDPVEGREGVVVIGATNDLNAIDSALLRPGRLEHAIQIPLPDRKARVAILKQHLADQEISGELTKFASFSRGWSGADIMKIARDARRLARRTNSQLSEDLLIEVMPARRALKPVELRRLAVHEAGHAILCVLLSTDILQYVFIEPFVTQEKISRALGASASVPIDNIIRTASWYEDRIAMMLGGIAAENIIYGNHSDGAGGVAVSDLAVASDLATIMEKHFGFGESLTVDMGSGNRPLESLRISDAYLRVKIDRRLKDQLDRATSMLIKQRTTLERLVDLLVTRTKVDGDEVRMLIKNHDDAACCMAHQPTCRHSSMPTTDSV